MSEENPVSTPESKAPSLFENLTSLLGMILAASDPDCAQIVPT